MTDYLKDMKWHEKIHLLWATPSPRLDDPGLFKDKEGAEHQHAHIHCSLLTLDYNMEMWVK